MALLRIGTPVLPHAVRLLRGQHDALVRFNTEARQAASEQVLAAVDASYRSTAAMVLGTLGRAEAIGPLVEALGQEQHDGRRTILARELTRLPSTEVSVRAFKEAYEQVSPDTRLGSGSSAREVLAASAVRLFDPSLVPWLVAQLPKTTGDPADKALEQAKLVGRVTSVVPPHGSRPQQSQQSPVHCIAYPPRRAFMIYPLKMAGSTMWWRRTPSGIPRWSRRLE